MSYQDLKGKVEPRCGGTRDEHLLWCMVRALAYLERGNVREGYTSMLSDLTKHPELANHKGGEIGVMLMLVPGWLDRRIQLKVLL
jgi:hypothetical protein